MSKITIIEGNSSDKDQVRNYMVKGERGDDGVSPTFETSKTGDTATITITDVEGEHEVELKDGVSPTVTPSKSGKVTTITIVDAEGTKTATINDGQDGATANIIDSATLTDNTAQTYSGRIADGRFVQNSNIAVITGTLTVDNNHSAEDTISYPTGFTVSNTYVISAIFGLTGSGITTYFAPMPYVSVGGSDGSYTVFGKTEYTLTDSDIYITLFDYNVPENTTYDYKLVLMKIS